MRRSRGGRCLPETSWSSHRALLGDRAASRGLRALPARVARVGVAGSAGTGPLPTAALPEAAAGFLLLRSRSQLDAEPDLGRSETRSRVSRTP